MVERRLPKANVASSSLVSRSNRQLLVYLVAVFFAFCSDVVCE